MVEYKTPKLVSHIFTGQKFEFLDLLLSKIFLIFSFQLKIKFITVLMFADVQNFRTNPVSEIFIGQILLVFM